MRPLLLVRCMVAVFSLLCTSTQAQTKTLASIIENLPTELRSDFIKDQIKDLYKRDTADARKQVNMLLTHFKNDKNLCADVFLAKASSLFKLAKVEDALVAITLAERYYVEIKNEEGEYSCIGLMVSIYRELNRSQDITAIIIKKLQASANNSKRECVLLQRLGLIFKDQGNIEKSLDYFDQALDKFEQIPSPTDKDIELQVSIERNLGVLYRNKNDLDKALFHLNKALALAETIHADNLKAAVLNSLGTLYRIRKEYYKAIQAYEESLKLKAELENLSGLSTTYTNLAELYLEINNFLKAEVNGIKAYEYGKLSKERMKVMNACEKLADIYEKMNRREKAFPYAKRAYQLRDSIYVASIAEQSAKLEAQFDIDKKRKEIELSKLKNEQLEETVAARKRERNMILTGSLVLVVLLAFAVKSYLDKRKANNLLEDKNLFIETQKQKVEEQHKEILDSITYAKRLQDAILPNENELEKAFAEYFIYYQPKSIVAGDFYWMEKANDVVLLAVADCTGHGVPGAMVSLVCSNALNRSVYEYGLSDPGKILDKTRELVLENFSKSQTDVKDGMDISLLSIDRGNNQIKWAGANNPLWYVSNNQFNELTANKQPIGKADNYVNFTTHTLQLQKGDTLFLFSDGYADQFGGPKGKKLKYKQMQEILLEGRTRALRETEKRIQQKFSEWKGDLEQVDDVCVIGVRI